MNIDSSRSDDALGWSVHLARGGFCVRIPAAKDLIYKNRYRQLHWKTLRNRCGRCGSSEMTTINDAPCHSRCCTLMNPHCSMAVNADQRSKFAAFYRSSWLLNLEWDVNKQNITFIVILNGFFYIRGQVHHTSMFVFSSSCPRM